MAKILRPPGEVRFHDAGIIVWEDPGRDGNDVAAWRKWQAYEEKFRRVILAGVIRVLRQRGWHVGPDADTVKNYYCLRKSHRQCTHWSGLQCELRQGGRCLEIKFYQNVKRPKGCNPLGGQYDFNKLEAMPYLLRKRCEMEMDYVAGWLVFNCEYTYKLQKQPCSVFGLDVDAYLEQDAPNRHWSGYKRAIHHDKPVDSYNSKCMDGVVKNGDRVYFLGGYVEQRWGVGIAEHNINNMWWVKVGKHEVRNVASHHLSHVIPEGGLRGRQILDWRRKERLEKLMLKAAKEQRYVDAERMRLAIEGKLYEANTATC